MAQQPAPAAAIEKASAAPPTAVAKVSFLPRLEKPEAAPVESGEAPKAPPSAAQPVAASAPTVLAAAVAAAPSTDDGRRGDGGVTRHDDDPSALALPAASPTAPPPAADATAAPPPNNTTPALAPPMMQVEAALRDAIPTKPDRIEIRLHPESLGTVEVRLHLYGDGSVAAHVTADRPETLQLLTSDAAQLEQSLRDSGLQAQAGSLSFSLRGDPNQPQGGGTGRGYSGRNTRLTAISATASTPAPTPAVRGQAAAAGALDIRI